MKSIKLTSDSEYKPSLMMLDKDFATCKQCSMQYLQLTQSPNAAPCMHNTYECGLPMLSNSLYIQNAMPMWQFIAMRVRLNLTASLTNLASQLRPH